MRFRYRCGHCKNMTKVTVPCYVFYGSILICHPCQNKMDFDNHETSI